VDAALLNGTDGFRIDTAVSEGDFRISDIGNSVSAAGDFNGDGIDDVQIGAPNGYSNVAGGDSFIIYGRTDGFAASVNVDELTPDTGVRLLSTVQADGAGGAVSGGGDINGDGFSDVLVSARFTRVPFSDYEAVNAGRVYVVYGAATTTGAQVGSTAADVLTAGGGAGVADVLNGAGGNDVLTSDGGADVLIGASGDDELIVVDTTFQRVSGGNGTDTLTLSGLGLILDLTAIPDNRVSDVEAIDISGTGDNTLTLDVREVLNISSLSNTLTVFRDPGDTVNIGPGWTDGGVVLANTQAFDRFTQGHATLLVQSIEPALLIPDTSTVPGRLILTESILVNSRINVQRQGQSLVVIAADPRSGFIQRIEYPLSGVRSLELRLNDGSSNVNLRNSPVRVSVLAGDGNDTVIGSRFADTIDGGAGNDRLLGKSGGDVIHGDAGNDVLLGGHGKDHLDGGSGRDRLNGQAGSDTLSGGSANDTMIGGSGDDELDGGAGRDRLNGQSGRDTLRGGEGVDRLRDRRGRTVVFDVVGGDVRLTRSLIRSDRGDHIHVRQITRLTLQGTDGDDRIRVDGFRGPVHFRGGDGNDTLIGGNGRDTLEGGDGNDVLLGRGGNDILAGQAGNDGIFGASGNDIASGGSGNDNIRGGGGSDTLLGAAGDDSLLGESGRDLILGESGADEINGGPQRDRVAAGGNDTSVDPGDAITGPATEINEALRFAFDRLLDGA